MSSWSYKPSLDGLRTVAVYLVLLYHAGIPWLGGGFIGVDLFFVLSGFLVTNVVLAELDRTGHVRLGAFYARRVRRLLPAALVVIVVTSVVFVLVASTAARLPVIGDAQSALLYVANWHFISQADDYFAAGSDRSPFLHFWSLSVEEQFYLFFPVLVLALTRLSRRRRAALPLGLAVVLVASMCCQVYWSGRDLNHAYYGTDARLYQLVAGALLAVALRRVPAGTRWARPLGAVASLVGLPLVVALACVPHLAPTTRSIGAAFASTTLIGGLMLSHGPVTRVLSMRVPVYLGRISYGTYLWHWPVIVVLAKVLHAGPRGVAFLALGVGTGLAALSYEVLEMPIRQARTLARHRWRAAIAGVAVSALVAVTLVPLTLHQQRKPVVVAGGPVGSRLVASSTGRQQVPADIDWKSLQQEKWDTADCTAADVQQCVLVRGDGPTLVIVGDSHAMMLVPMFERLARKHHFTLAVNAIAGCMWQEGLINTRAPKDRRDDCTRHRVGWYEQALPRLHPDLVLLAGRPMDGVDHLGRFVRRRDGKHQTLDRMTLLESLATAQRVSRISPQTLILDPVVVPESFDPLDCLSGARRIDQCAVPVTSGTRPSAAFYTSVAARIDNVRTLDLNPAFCPGAPMCEPLVHGTVVWRDAAHLTQEITVQQRHRVWKLLRHTGALPG